jgi:hypothetical protein
MSSPWICREIPANPRSLPLRGTNLADGLVASEVFDPIGVSRLDQTMVLRVLRASAVKMVVRSF